MASNDGPALNGVKACVFDAYGTLFDFAAAARGCGECWATTSTG
jgi:FMN phosphatase YigB (HAD superfamily)